MNFSKKNSRIPWHLRRNRFLTNKSHIIIFINIIWVESNYRHRQRHRQTNLSKDYKTQTNSWNNLCFATRFIRQNYYLEIPQQNGKEQKPTKTERNNFLTKNSVNNYFASKLQGTNIDLFQMRKTWRRNQRLLRTKAQLKKGLRTINFRERKICKKVWNSLKQVQKSTLKKIKGG